MKEPLTKTLKVVVTCLTVALFVLGIYYTIINILHASYLKETHTINELDENYVSFQENLSKIETNLKKYKYANDKFAYNKKTLGELSEGINKCLYSLKSNDGLAQYKIDDKVGYQELAKLNNYFLNNIVNECWILSLGFITLNPDSYKGYLNESFTSYNRLVNLLVDNADYLNEEFNNNSSYHYSNDYFQIRVFDEINRKYTMVTRNYQELSNIILEISNYLVVGAQNEQKNRNSFEKYKVTLINFCFYYDSLYYDLLLQNA